MVIIAAQMLVVIAGTGLSAVFLVLQGYRP
jgi:hypothetical protein